MQVSLNATMPGENLPPHLPTQLVLKVYDRRFAHGLREYYGLQPLKGELEALYHQYVASGRAPEGYDAISDRIDEYGGFKQAPPELLEHFVANEIAPYFRNEYLVYHRLQSLQGRDIPRLYGSTEFNGNSSIPGLSTSVPGILLELIEGINLEEIDPSSFDLNNVFNDALRIIDQCGELGVLNHDVRLSNFIVRPRGSVVMIDFAQARLRRGDETDLDWKRMKWDEDEEGCVGAAAAKKFGWRYIRSLKYCPPFERESY
ncbi:hypothetical protein BN14_09738 [Rhizoctonia solani AG-1 IB]|uniref:Protein kinase domain-containing protein n=1 Tax=Thanatephorus cucumeris (strain AG1-IB / isolate 7/3/14) TaxID=1108050 RepID=M5C9C9_THACB|nr:hypothetical protein BN14_09738 [Rhizoctonia solani AG-1 IB]